MARLAEQAWEQYGMTPAELMKMHATAYHEAGHAAMVLLLGRKLESAEVEDARTGVVWHMSKGPSLSVLIEVAEGKKRISPELLRRWIENMWISDAGMIAEEEFNLVPLDELVQGGMGDLGNKLRLIPPEKYAFVKAYFHSHLGSYSEVLTEACRELLRMPKISTHVRIIAEALLRYGKMGGDEIIDIVLAHRAGTTRHADMFWETFDESIFDRVTPRNKPRQLGLQWR